MKRTILFSLAIIITALAAVGCCDCRKRSKLEKPFVGTTWQLVQIIAKDVNPEGDCYTILFRDNGTLSGKGDCNVFTATYRMTASRELSLSELGTTRRYSPNHEAEAEYFDMLEGVTHYEMDADHMLLLKSGTLVGIMKAVGETADEK